MTQKIGLLAGSHIKIELGFDPRSRRRFRLKLNRYLTQGSVLCVYLSYGTIDPLLCATDCTVYTVKIYCQLKIRSRLLFRQNCNHSLCTKQHLSPPLLSRCTALSFQNVRVSFGDGRISESGTRCEKQDVKSKM